jgi:hypothetical protein
MDAMFIANLKENIVIFEKLWKYCLAYGIIFLLLIFSNTVCVL